MQVILTNPGERSGYSLPRVRWLVASPNFLVPTEKGTSMPRAESYVAKPQAIQYVGTSKLQGAVDMLQVFVMYPGKVPCGSS